jgi:hypothetical protein
MRSRSHPRAAQHALFQSVLLGLAAGADWFFLSAKYYVGGVPVRCSSALGTIECASMSGVHCM